MYTFDLFHLANARFAIERGEMPNAEQLQAFARESEHVNLCSSESHASVDTALDLCTGEYVRMY